MSGARAWSFLAVDGVRQYGGNIGYDDDPSSVYRYDSDVANHLRVRRGDVAVVRSRHAVLGIAMIDEIIEDTGKKARLRCPECGATNIKQRTTLQPAWACRNGHVFDEPLNESISVKTFEAHYGSSFQKCSSGLTLARLHGAVIRPSDQMSIKEIDLGRLEGFLVEQSGTRAVLLKFTRQIGLMDVPVESTDGPTSIVDERRRIMREISLRRGQARFRDRLVRRYGAMCQISRCGFSGLVEAAHIRPYALTGDNSAHNGLLLRTDLHTLFDLGLISVHPTSLLVIFHPAAVAAGYGPFEGVGLAINGTNGPDRAALAERWEFFQTSISNDKGIPLNGVSMDI